MNYLILHSHSRTGTRLDQGRTGMRMCPELDTESLQDIHTESGMFQEVKLLINIVLLIVYCC